MNRVLAQPVFPHQASEVEDAVIAALAAEVIWLCRSGELDQLYNVYPDFMSRTAAMQRVFKIYRSEGVAKKFPGRTVHFVAACHDHGASLVLQVMDRHGRAMPAADALISIRLREGLAPDGRPLPDHAEER